MKFQRTKENGCSEECELVKMVRGEDEAMVEVVDIARFEKAGYETVDYEPADASEEADAIDDDSDDDSSDDDKGQGPADPVSLVEAIASLDHENDAHWTSKGLPDMKTIEAMVGDSSITRPQVEEISEGLRRNK